MTAGVVIERGFIDGVAYRVWQRYDGKKIVYIGEDSRRRNMSWLKKMKQESKGKYDGMATGPVQP